MPVRVTLNVTNVTHVTGNILQTKVKIWTNSMTTFALYAYILLSEEKKNENVEVLDKKNLITFINSRLVATNACHSC